MKIQFALTLATLLSSGPLLQADSGSLLGRIFQFADSTKNATTATPSIPPISHSANSYNVLQSVLVNGAGTVSPRPLILVTDPKSKILETIEEDLPIMGRILEKTIEDKTGKVPM